MKKFLLVFLSIIVIAFFFLGCSEQGSTTGASEYTISGKVIDSVTGDGVANAKVGFGSNILTTDASGNYSVTVAANTAITGNFYVSKGTDYNFTVFSGLNLTPTSDLSYDIKIKPVDTSTYATHTVSGNVYQSDGTTIANESSVNISIYNENGGSSSQSATYNSGYSIDTKTFGTSCVLFIKVNNGTNTAFNYYIENVDLSATTVTLNLKKPSTGYSTVTVTGEENDNFTGTMIYSDSISFNQVAGLIDNTKTADVQIYNPAGKNFFWLTRINQSGPSPGDSTKNYKTSAASVPGSEVTLPVPSLAAPTEAVSGTSITYSAGTLSFTGSADLYSIYLEPDGGGISGFIMSPTISVELPDDIVDIITSTTDGYTSWEAYIMPVNTSVSFNIALFLATQSSNGISPGLEYAMVQGADSASTGLIP